MGTLDISLTRRALYAVAVIAVAGMAGPTAASAEDTLKLAIGQRGLLDTSISHLGQQAGIFKKHGLVLDLLYTQGGGETMQAVISNSVDIGIAAGTGGVMAAYVKGAPLRIISAQATGSAEFWYVPATSPIKTLADAKDKTIAYSTAGSSTNSMALALAKQYNPTLKLVATGSPPSTLTQVMSGQVDIGWASPPFGLKELDAGTIRMVAKATDSLEVRDQTLRVNFTNLAAIEKKKDQLARYLQGYRETIDWIYSSPDFAKTYAAFAGIDEAAAKRIRDEFFPKALLNPDKVSGLDTVMADAIAQKFITQPLTKDQLAELIQIPQPVK
ncbi:MAG: ABC transporter substrate-binding protein [Gemmatimonas sp.]